MLNQELASPMFKDIPLYTGDGFYQITVPLAYLERSLADYQDNNDLDMDADFQRAHVWGESRQCAYVEHLLRGGKGSETIRFNCPDWGQTFEKLMVLVDGKQRLTACLRFLHNEIPAFGFTHSKYKDRIPMNVNLRFMVNNLKTRAEVLRWYLQINEGGVVHTYQELEKVRQLLAKERFPKALKRENR